MYKNSYIPARTRKRAELQAEEQQARCSGVEPSLVVTSKGDPFRTRTDRTSSLDTQSNIVFFTRWILRDETMADKLIYIPNQ